MGCGPGIGGALMDDLIYPRLWLVEDENECKNKETEDSDHDIRKLFPKKESKKATIGKFSKKGTPEWLAMSVGVFFVGALFTIASYQVYSGSFSDQLSHVSIHEDIPEVFADEPETGSDIKLPTNVEPLSYKLYLSISVLKKEYTGVITILLKCLAMTDRIVLHSARHKLDSSMIILRTADKRRIFIKNHFRDKVSERLTLVLNETLVPGNSYNLLISFYNNLDDDYNNGIYLTKYKDGNGDERSMVSQDFEPTKARKAFPCFDEPALKATWRIIIRPVDTGYHAISNMRLEKQVPLKDGTMENFFYTTPNMSSYLISIAVTEYEYQEGVSSKNVTVRVYAPIGRLSETSKPLEFALYSVDYYSKAFGIDYMFPKLYLFPVTKFSAGADESWGNLVFLESLLLLDQEKSSQSSYKRVCQTVAHEISHQWFGDLVTMKWWNNLWLKESFAAYLENFPVQELYPSWNTQKTSFESTMDGLSYDSSKYTHPVASSELDPKKLENSYDIITYEKGASVVSMLGRFVGNKNFWAGLKIFLNRYKYNSATEEQLWEALAEADNVVDIPGIMKTWINFKGFPLITVERKGDKLIFEQERFSFRNLNLDVHNDSQIWKVPLHIKICGQIQKYLLEKKRGYIHVDKSCDPSKEYKVNYHSGGYYHVNYADDNWSALLKTLNRNHEELPAIDRAGLLFDLTSLLRFNHVDITLALSFTEYFDREHDPIVWSNGLNMLNHVRHVFYENKKIKSCMEKYVQGKIEPVLFDLKKFTVHSHDQISLIQTLLTYIVSYDMQIHWLNPLLENKFYKWLVNQTPLPTNERYQIISFGIRFGGVHEFDKINQTRMNAKSIEEKQHLLGAMAMTKDGDLLKRLLDEGVAKMDGRALQHVCFNRNGRSMAFRAIKKNWDALKKRFQSDSGLLHYILSACLDPGTTEADKVQAKAFLDKSSLERWTVYVERSIEKIEQNIDFARHREDVENWCDRKYGQ